MSDSASKCPHCGAINWQSVGYTMAQKFGMVVLFVIGGVVATVGIADGDEVVKFVGHRDCRMFDRFLVWADKKVRVISMLGWYFPKHIRRMRTLLALAMCLTLCVFPTLTGCSKAEQASVPEQPPPDELQVRHDQLYTQAMQSFVAPATNSMLEIFTKNNVRQRGTVDFISHDKLVLDIGGKRHTYNRDWLSPQTREKILAPDYAEAFVRNTFRAEQEKIEKDKAAGIREEKERAEKESAARMAEAERRRIEREKMEQQEALWRAQVARAEKDKAENEARRYDLELQRQAEREWNENARKTGGPQFVGEPGSGQLDSNPRNRYRPVQPQGEEAAIAYATRIGGLVGGAAGLEYQLNQMIETAKQYQDIAEYSPDWNEQVKALRKAEALILSIPHIKREYYDAENTLISLRARDGQLFDDAMRVTVATPEVDPIIRAYCRRLIGE